MFQIIFIVKLVGIALFLETTEGFHRSLPHRRIAGKCVMMAGFGKKGDSLKPMSSNMQPAMEQKKLISTNPKTRKLVRQGNGSIVRDMHCPTFNNEFPGLKTIYSDPPVFEIENFFPEKLCADYILRASNEGFMIPSQTFSATSGSKRTSTTWYLKYDQMPELLEKANMLTGIPFCNYEEPQIVRYEIGQQFSWHFDSIPKSMMTSSGNRVATLIVYLNNVEGGGATCFQDLKIQVQPKVGKALLFFPSFKDGSPDERTSHCGQVAMDTKWIAQMWIHERPYEPKIPKGSNHADGVEAALKYRQQQQQQQQQ